MQRNGIFGCLHRGEEGVWVQGEEGSHPEGSAFGGKGAASRWKRVCIFAGWVDPLPRNYKSRNAFLSSNELKERHKSLTDPGDIRDATFLVQFLFQFGAVFVGKWPKY